MHQRLTNDHHYFGSHKKMPKNYVHDAEEVEARSTTDYEDETTSSKPTLTNCVDLSSFAIKAAAIKAAIKVAKTK